MNIPPSAQLPLAAFVAFASCLSVYPSYIKWLKNKQVEQYLREDGPQSHAHKARTPTMGGVVFSIATVIISLATALLFSQPVVQPVGSPLVSPIHLTVLGVAIVCGLIGFLDDYAKVTSKSNIGISGYLRLGIEILIGAGLGILILASNQCFILLPDASSLATTLGGQFGEMLGTGIWVPPAIIFIPLAAFVVAATANSLNLHDGMDGLCAGTACQVFACLSFILFASQQRFLGTIAAIMAGALCAFLMFNRNPASIFMGDTGSLFVGGLMAAIVIAGGLVFWFIPLSLIYIAESVSVIMQVLYFKLTKTYEGEEKDSLLTRVKTKLTRRLPGQGKRLFRMAPLHHHYEQVMAEKGWEEWQVVLAFWIVQLILVVIVISGYMLLS